MCVRRVRRDVTSDTRPWDTEKGREKIPSDLRFVFGSGQQAPQAAPSQGRPLGRSWRTACPLPLGCLVTRRFTVTHSTPACDLIRRCHSELCGKESASFKKSHFTFFSLGKLLNNTERWGRRQYIILSYDTCILTRILIFKHMRWCLTSRMRSGAKSLTWRFWAFYVLNADFKHRIASWLASCFCSVSPAAWVLQCSSSRGPQLGARLHHRQFKIVSAK